MKIKPMNDYVLVEILDGRKETKSGISLSTSVNMPYAPDRGIVKEVSDKVTEVSVGDRVMFERYQGERIEEKEGTFVMMHVGAILCIMPEDFDVTLRQDQLI